MYVGVEREKKRERERDDVRKGEGLILKHSDLLCSKGLADNTVISKVCQLGCHSVRLGEDKHLCPVCIHVGQW